MPARGKASKRAGAATKKSKGKAAGKVRKAPAKAARREGPSIEAVARKIVSATIDPSRFRLEDLYTEASVSVEPGAAPAVTGLAGLRRKTEMWNQIQEAQTWRPRSILAKGNTVMIEWDADVTLRGGRKVSFKEVAVHEIKAGKIAAERYYYDPAQLAPPSVGARLGGTMTETRPGSAPASTASPGGGSPGATPRPSVPPRPRVDPLDL